MDTPYYLDNRPPFFVSDLAAVTLSTTLKALYTAASHPNLGPQYWPHTGKKLWLRAFLKVITFATPGNLVLSLLYGTGADANGVTLASSAAIALIANQTFSLEVDLFVRAISLGATGTLEANGRAHANPIGIASTAQPIMIPAAGAAVSAAVDETASLVLSLQASRSGSTAETIQVQDLHFVPMN